MKSVFLSNIHYAYAQTDGTYKFPNSQEGDMLKQAKKEIEILQDWKDQMLFVESQWDEQFVGTLLNMKLGDSIRKNIEPKIINLKDALTEIWALTQFDWDTMPELGRKNFHELVESISDEALKN
jgi:hypothetical protein